MWSGHERCFGPSVYVSAIQPTFSPGSPPPLISSVVSALWEGDPTCLQASTDYTAADANIGGSEAFDIVTEPDEATKTMGVGWDTFTPFSQSVPGTYSKETTFTDTNTISTGVPVNGPYYDITLETGILTNSTPGADDSAYAYIDPMIRIDPSTQNAQDYQIVFPESILPVPEPTSLGLVGVSAVSLVEMLILRRCRAWFEEPAPGALAVETWSDPGSFALCFPQTHT